MTASFHRGALWAGAVVVVVVTAVGAALFVLDSPAEERRRRLDERRIADLHAIADAVDAYWKRENELPTDLERLDGWNGIDLTLSDPVAATRYGYRITGDREYELCARFATRAPGDDRTVRWRRGENFWHHPAGDHCFSVRIDPAPE